MEKIKLIYYDFLERQSESDRELLQSFFAEFDLNFSISIPDRRRIREDFELAIIALSERGVSIKEALSRLALSNLGGFYARPSVMWFPLDDAAKIYPISMDHDTQNLFRLSIYFKEDVIPELMQMALTFTIKRFPSFATCLKKGFFWHYLDAVKKRFALEEEKGVPCQPIKVSISGSSSFRLTYYKNRVSAEFFHVITDGTGGMIFLKAIASEYLRLLGVKVDENEENDIWDVNETPMNEEFENTFVKIDRAKSGSGFVDKKAVQMSGKLSGHRPSRMIHFKMPTDKLLSAARSLGTTVTVYLLMNMFLACSAATDELTGDINIQVPVNMRKFYNTRTVRNFAMFCGIRVPMEKISDRSSLVSEISTQLAEKSTKENMHRMITAACSIVGAIRYIPLIIKQPVAKTVYGFLGETNCTTTLSNLGVVKLPKAYLEHIESMDFCLGAPEINRLACAAVTVGNTTTFSITKNTADPTFEEKMYKFLTDDGINVAVEGSDFYGN